MKKLPVLFIMLVVAALSVAACGGGPAPAPSGGGQAAPSGNATPKAQAPDKPAAKPTDKPGEPPATNSNSQATDLLELTDVTEGLNSLKSYESIFTMGFKGTDNSQPKEWSWTVTEQFVKEPPAKRSSIVGFGTDATGKDSTIETIEVGGKTYSRFGEICTSSDASEAPTANTGFTPSSVIGDIKTAQLLGTDNINGVTAQHYQVDVSAMNTLGAYTNSKSEVWIAQPGDFVVKYSFEATGKDTFFGGGSNTEGTITWAYELKSANQPIAIEPPNDCGGTPEDIPVMTDATDESSFGTMSTYSSASAFDVVVEFYKKEMVTKGWAAQEGGLAMDGFAQLSFTKDTRTASVMITADKDKNVTTVMVTIETK
ncbi:MAG: hypothetical protein KA765_03020 [Thermoflexales bacterium]|nr:hypothetical protein [Thermoflexales bacterium]